MSWTTSRVLAGCFLAGIAATTSACGNGNGGDDDADAHVPAETELYHDDGVGELAQAPIEDTAGGQIAVSFTPPGYPATIESARLYVAVAGAPSTQFGVRVYLADGPGHSPGTDLLATQVVAAGTDGNEWVDVDLSEHELVVAEGDFCVAMEWLTATGMSQPFNAQFIGGDQSKPNARTWWWYESQGVWQRAIDVVTFGDVDSMIRAVVVH